MTRVPDLPTDDDHYSDQAVPNKTSKFCSGNCPWFKWGRLNLEKQTFRSLGSYKLSNKVLQDFHYEPLEDHQRAIIFPYHPHTQ